MNHIFKFRSGFYTPVSTKCWIVSTFCVITFPKTLNNFKRTSSPVFLLLKLVNNSFENLYSLFDFWCKFILNIFVWINKNIKKERLNIFQLLVSDFYRWLLSIKKYSFLIQFRWKFMNNIFKHALLWNKGKNWHF